MLKDDFKNHKTYLWGTGLEGQAVISWWQENLAGQELGVIEENIIPDDAEIIIKSPGVSAYLPQIADAKAKDVKFTSLMNIFLAELHAKPKTPKIIGITGTKGKSTTSSLLAFMLGRLGFKVGLGGNIGASPLDFLKQDLDYIVLELSSFQITDLEYDLDYGLIVNISHAHLDWHLSLDNYVNDKLRIKDRVGKLIVNKDDEKLKRLDNVDYYCDENGFHVENGKVYYGDEELNVPELQIKGEHNLGNLCGGLKIIHELGLDYKSVIASLSEFEALPHRLQQVHKKDGFTFVDDSIATVAESTMAAINAYDEDVAVIIGGFDNNPDYSQLDVFVTENPKVKVVLCLPDTGRLLKTPKGIMVDNMHQAVTEAVKKLGQGVVLLSPAAPSFNLYKNYKERGYDFAKIAKEVV